MRTNIELDTDLLEEFRQLSGSKSKKEAVHKALAEAIRSFKRRKLASLKGKVRWNGDLEEWRKFRF